MGSKQRGTHSHVLDVKQEEGDGGTAEDVQQSTATLSLAPRPSEELSSPTGRQGNHLLVNVDDRNASASIQAFSFASTRSRL